MKRALADIQRRISQLESPDDRIVQESDTGKLRRQNWLHETIDVHFSIGEMRGLILSLGIDPEMVPGETKDEISLELVLYTRRHGKTKSLLRRLKRLRPLVDWEI